jgi:Flp pilus assembly protein TadD
MSRNQQRQLAKQAARSPSPPVRPSLDQLFADAIAHHMAGREDQAEQLYRMILAVPPVQAETSYNLGLLYQTKGRLVEAVAAYRYAVLLKQDHIDAYCNLATALQDLGQRDEAIEIYHKAIAIHPDFAMAYCNLGVALKEQRQAEQSLAAYRRAIDLRPSYDFAFANMAAVLLDLGRLDDAKAACSRAIELNPLMPMAHFNLGATLKAENKPAEAEAVFRDAIKLNPDFTEAHFTFAQVLLHQEKYREGWDEYEWRWKLPQYRWLRDMHGDFAQPLWQGEDITGKTLLVYCEQGVGDALQYVRYIRQLIAERGVHVILAVHPPLLRLLAQIEGATVIALDQVPLPAFDLHCPLISLPRLFGTDKHNIPAEIPYLSADPADIERWRRRIPGQGKRVGIVWAGNPDQTGDALRSPRLKAVLPLFEVPGVTFVALQVGPGRADLEKYPLPANVIDLGPEIGDFADTAAIISGLDLVISSCTAPLHLAAALGVPTWGMIPFAPHFLWQNDRTDSPWYPNLRLYRQAEAGNDWRNVTAAISDDLAKLADQD